jgi:CRP-like cAMP-binding protein
MFGELGLLYDVPSPTTIVAKTNSVLLTLSRYTFNRIIKDIHKEKRDKYSAILNKIELLDTLEAHEKLKITDCL